MVGLPVRGERNDMNWGDQDMVAKQNQRVLQIVEQFKDHPGSCRLHQSSILHTIQVMMGM